MYGCTWVVLTSTRKVKVREEKARKAKAGRKDAMDYAQGDAVEKVRFIGQGENTTSPAAIIPASI